MQASALAPEKGVAYFEYDFDKHGGAQEDIEVKGHGIPKGALVVAGMIDVIEAVTSDGSATVSAKLEGSQDLLADKAKGDMGDDAKVDVVPDGTASNAIRTTAAVNSITITPGTADLTAGKFVVALEYFRPRG